MRREDLDAGPDQDFSDTPLVRDSEVTRVELIDHRRQGGFRAQSEGRVFVALGCRVELSFQDDGRTLKVFVEDRP